MAALAGIPATVIDDARAMLESLEAESNARARQDNQGQMPLFEGPAAEAPADQRLREFIDALDPDSMTPKQALETLYELKALLD